MAHGSIVKQVIRLNGPFADWIVVGQRELKGLGLIAKDQSTLKPGRRLAVGLLSCNLAALSPWSRAAPVQTAAVLLLETRL